MFYPSCPGKSAKRIFAPDVPGIHVFPAAEFKDVDGRKKPGRDGENRETNVERFRR
jgi:hypothetical protein